MSTYQDENAFTFTQCPPEDISASSSRQTLDDITNTFDGIPFEYSWSPPHFHSSTGVDDTARASEPRRDMDANIFTNEARALDEFLRRIEPEVFVSLMTGESFSETPGPVSAAIEKTDAVEFEQEYAASTAIGKRKRELADEGDYDTEEESGNDEEVLKDDEEELVFVEDEPVYDEEDFADQEDESADGEDDPAHEDDNPKGEEDSEEDPDRAGEDDAENEHTNVEQSDETSTSAQFICTWEGCGRPFARQADRDRHLNVHTHSAPVLVCQVCRKTFTSARADSLRRHQIEAMYCVKKQKMFTDDQLRDMNCVTSAERAMSKARAKSRKRSQKPKAKSQKKSRKA